MEKVNETFQTLYSQIKENIPTALPIIFKPKKFKKKNGSFFVDENMIIY